MFDLDLDRLEDSELETLRDQITMKLHDRALARPKCPECWHDWPVHEREIKIGFPGKETVYVECEAYMGMADWCGCPRKIPEEYR